MRLEVTTVRTLACSTARFMAPHRTTVIQQPHSFPPGPSTDFFRKCTQACASIRAVQTSSHQCTMPGSMHVYRRCVHLLVRSQLLPGFRSSLHEAVSVCFLCKRCQRPVELALLCIQWLSVTTVQQASLFSRMSCWLCTVRRRVSMPCSAEDNMGEMQPLFSINTFADM